MTREELIDIFFIKDKNNNYKFNFCLYKKLPEDDVRKISLNNYYVDSSSLEETYIRLKNNWDVVPTCPTCGKKLTWQKSKRRFQNYCNSSCATKNSKVQEKRKNTCLERYGVENNSQSILNKEKVKNTCLRKYGVVSPLSNKVFRMKAENTKLEKYGSKTYNNPKKTNKTCLERYGSYRNYKSIEKTMLEKYGVNSYLKTKEIGKIRNNEKILNKINSTKQKNNSFNISKLENISFKLLKEKYQDVKRQYKSKLYPYLADFYIPSIDLYIECNYHWTHGSHAYDPQSVDDKKTLDKWKQKSTKFYINAINTWTIRDVNKRETARQNKLNYIEVWSIDELDRLIKKISNDNK